MNLDGKIAVVTGGSRGIGASSAYQLADAGANIALTYSTSAEEAEEEVSRLEGLSIEARAYKADASKPESLPEIVDQIVNDLGDIEILVNNAGTFAGGMILAGQLCFAWNLYKTWTGPHKPYDYRVDLATVEA